MNEDRLAERLEILNTIVLSVATLAIAWCTYQGSLWNGVQTITLIESNATDRHATEKSMMTRQLEQIDAAAVLNFVNAVVDKNQNRVNFYLTHARPEMARILSGWLKTDPLNNPKAPAHPMAMEDYRKILNQYGEEEAQLRKTANELKSKGLHANLYSDNYGLFTVVFGMVLFINGISSKVTNPKIVRFFSIASAVICLIALMVLFTTLPITAPG